MPQVRAPYFRSDLCLQEVRACMVQSWQDEIHSNHDLLGMCDNSALAREFQCAVCMDLVGPEYLVTPCQHMFCKDCILEAAKSRRACPTCNAPLPEAVAVPPMMTVRNFVDGLRLTCHTCRTSMNKRQMHIHIEQGCPEIRVACPAAEDGCDFSGTLAAFAEHVDACRFLRITCTLCMESVPQSLQVQHRTELCKFRGHEEFMRALLDREERERAAKQRAVPEIQERVTLLEHIVTVPQRTLMHSSIVRLARGSNCPGPLRAWSHGPSFGIVVSFTSDLGTVGVLAPGMGERGGVWNYNARDLELVPLEDMVEAIAPDGSGSPWQPGTNMLAAAFRNHDSSVSAIPSSGEISMIGPGVIGGYQAIGGYSNPITPRGLNSGTIERLGNISTMRLNVPTSSTLTAQTFNRASSPVDIRELFD